MSLILHNLYLPLFKKLVKRKTSLQMSLSTIQKTIRYARSVREISTKLLLLTIIASIYMMILHYVIVICLWILWQIVKRWVGLTQERRSRIQHFAFLIFIVVITGVIVRFWPYERTHDFPKFLHHRSRPAF